MFNIGVDVGGTFTDAVAVGEDGGLNLGKAPTTPERIADGVIASLEDLARNSGTSLTGLLGQTRFLGHGTTVGTNALIIRSGARVGLLTTAGFEDTPFIQRAIGRLAGLTDEQLRHQVSLRQPVPLVERACIRGVVERVDSRGQVVIALSQKEAERAVGQLIDQGVEAVGICLLWSFLNPSHEQLLAETVRALAPDLQLSVSSEFVSKIRENARCNTVIIDAFVKGKVRDYLSDLNERLGGLGFSGSVASMQCFGGVTDSQFASPISTIESGPVGGVMGSKYLARLTGEENVITTDVGGTTFDVSVIRGGEEIIAREFFGAAGVMSRFEVLTPRVDINSVGAGGGTIASYDPASHSIKFGPKSAGSSPGPVFYGTGGERVTLADAWLTLGYLNPKRFLGGRIYVDAGAARAAIEDQIAKPLGMDVNQAALAILRLANHHMSDAIKVYLAARGQDVEDFSLFAFGGGGPMHAAAYGRLAGVKRTYLIANGGVFSAFGIALADTKHKQQMTLLEREPFDLQALATSFEKLNQNLDGQFERQGLGEAAITYRYFLDLRYRGQVHDATVEIPDPDWFLNGGMASIRERFDEHYQTTFDTTASAYSEIELVGLGLDGVAQLAKPSLLAGEASGEMPTPKGERQAWFEDADEPLSVPIFEHAGLCADQEISGPAFVEDDYHTIIVLPGQSARVDGFGNLVIEHGAREGRSNE